VNRHNGYEVQIKALLEKDTTITTKTRSLKNEQPYASQSQAIVFIADKHSI